MNMPVNLENDFYDVLFEDGALCAIRIKSTSIETKNAQIIKMHVIQMIKVKGFKSLMIDMSNLKYVDSFGLAYLVSIMKHCESAGGHMALVRPTSVVLQLIEITRLANLLNIFDSMDDAKAFITANH
jgi:anti-anti-sigma factor